MFLLLTDRLTCPMCGPAFGLVLLADRLVDRVVHEGRLGCPNCKESFPITEGFGDLRVPPRGMLEPGLAGQPGSAGGGPDAESGAGRLVALLGIIGGPGWVALVGEPARWAAAVARALPELNVIAVDPDLRHWPQAAGVSRLACGPGLPLMTASLRGAVIDGRLGEGWLREGARAVAPRARVVVEHLGEGSEATLTEVGLRVIAREAESVVAARS